MSQDEQAVPSRPAQEGAPARRPTPWRPAGWALGLPAAAILALVCIVHFSPAIERDIRRAAMLPGAAGSPILERHRARPEIDGRDVAIMADIGLPDEVRSVLEASLRQAPGVRSVRIEIATAIAMSPFGLTIRRDPSAIAFAGGIPSADGRARLVDEAARTVSRDAIDDRLRLGAGAPDGFADAAAWLLAILGRAETGEATLSDRVANVTAVAPDGRAYDAIQAALRSPPAGFRLESAEITPPRIDPFTWAAVRDRDVVTLEGAIPSEAARARLLAVLATALPGATIRDDTRTAVGLPADLEFDAVTGPALAALAALSSGRAELNGRRFAFTGDGVVRAEIDGVAARLREALPSGLEVRSIAIRAVPASPYRVAARRSGGRVTLSGFVPAETDRRRAATLVTARYPGERLVDARLVAEGAPAEFAAGERFALETLSEFAEGEAVILDRDIRVSGRILYGQLAARLRAAIPRGAPPGWTASAAIEPVVPENALDTILCGDLLGDTIRREPIRFEAGKAEPVPASKPALDAAGDIVRRCGAVRIRVVHHLGDGRDPEAARGLASERAAVIASALAERGATARLSGTGVTSGAGGAERTEFVVTKP